MRFVVQGCTLVCAILSNSNLAAGIVYFLIGFLFYMGAFCLGYLRTIMWMIRVRPEKKQEEDHITAADTIFKAKRLTVLVMS